jgi:hypothetical protein
VLLLDFTHNVHIYCHRDQLHQWLQLADVKELASEVQSEVSILVLAFIIGFVV